MDKEVVCVCCISWGIISKYLILYVTHMLVLLSYYWHQANYISTTYINADYTLYTT